MKDKDEFFPRLYQKKRKKDDDDEEAMRKKNAGFLVSFVRSDRSPWALK